ncbi:sulfite exporter TauE/SafE family protein [Desulfallas sp. Bu1-1]|uniref:sulfite exporter TauE/SafE family protein n=1 Tax=Desulfallas sp. Bu1-1 TaxID=2787620 RepID=UPI00189F6601|nr:sulfite exporter TauE/SafE family protein [Desulfallas sp. Bu1-1]MBF7084530.1 sulfite exporter TauE/SafE family protein [Desulfallas sp. Bu1-1]
MYTFFSIIAALSAGFFKTAFGVGGGVITPLLSLVMNPKIAVTLMAPVFLATDITTLWVYWKRWDLKYIFIILPGMLIGVLLGTYYLNWASPRLTKITIGIIAVIFSSNQFIQYKYPGVFKKVELNVAIGIIISFFGGIISAIAHAGGIVISIYLVTKNLSKSSFVATLTGILFFSNIVKIVMYAKLQLITKPIFITSIKIIPFLVLGSLLGKVLNNKLSNRHFMLYVNLLLFISGIVLIIHH